MKMTPNESAVAQEIVDFLRNTASKTPSNGYQHLKDEIIHLYKTKALCNKINRTQTLDLSGKLKAFITPENEPYVLSRLFTLLRKSNVENLDISDNNLTFSEGEALRLRGFFHGWALASLAILWPSVKSLMPLMHVPLSLKSTFLVVATGISGLSFFFSAIMVSGEPKLTTKVVPWYLIKSTPMKTINFSKNNIPSQQLHAFKEDSGVTVIQDSVVASAINSVRSLIFSPQAANEQVQQPEISSHRKPTHSRKASG